jgi:hypothetical protein
MGFIKKKGDENKPNFSKLGLTSVNCHLNVYNILTVSLGAKKKNCDE